MYKIPPKNYTEDGNSFYDNLNRENQTSPLSDMNVFHTQWGAISTWEMETNSWVKNDRTVLPGEAL